MRIPFNKPYMTGKELWYISKAHNAGHLSGDGPLTRKCHDWLENQIGCRKALLTNSCTSALEMAAILANIESGDEVIMPSYTFVSTANAFVLRGGVPVFVDIRPDTLNLDETKLKAAITEKTKAIAPVHYAGVSCEMDQITEIAREYGLLVIEDAAQAIMCKYKGRPLGSLGQLAAVSFHETKTIISGEGGALFINDLEFVERAEIIREKGTNRTKFFRGEVGKYTWLDIGSSYLPSELISSFLWAQMEEAESIICRRMAMWNAYHESLAELESLGFIRRPIIPADCKHNAHMYYIRVSGPDERAGLLSFLNTRGIHAIFHYVPLHSSPAGIKYGRPSGELKNTEMVSSSLLRLPLWVGLDIESVHEICDLIYTYFRVNRSRHPV
jgi:dTDP-4-amino-4,6-dideoxygalactose transaminase